MISGEGMPIYRRSHENGNLFIEFDVKFPPPNWLPAERLADLDKILPPRPQKPNFANKVVDEYTLEQVDPSRQAGGGRRDATDDDEEQGGPQVQCAQQ